MKLTTLKLLTALAIAAPAAGYADALTIYTGGAGGGYDAAARNISERLSQRGVDVSIENRNGSDDITLQACNDEGSAVWIAQKDALWVRETQDGCGLVDLGIYSTEYAMIFFPPGSKNDELSHLKENDSVLVDKVGSGSELAWRNMTAIEVEHGKGDAWSKVSVVAKSPKRATSMAQRGTIQAVFLVRTLKSDDVSRLLEQGWDMGYMYDRDINDLKWNGKPLYDAEKVAIIMNGKRKDRDWAYVIPSFFGTTEQVERDKPDLFDKILSAVQ